MESLSFSASAGKQRRNEGAYGRRFTSVDGPHAVVVDKDNDDDDDDHDVDEDDDDSDEE